MKSIQFIIAFTITAVLSCASKEKNTTTKHIDPSISKIEMIEFHSNHRCETCNAVESGTKYTLKSHFIDELKAGDITFKLVNVEKQKNKELAKEFNATGTALFLNVIKNGKQKRIDLTDFSLSNAKNREKFSEELKDRIDAELMSLKH